MSKTEGEPMFGVKVLHISWINFESLCVCVCNNYLIEHTYSMQSTWHKLSPREQRNFHRLHGLERFNFNVFLGIAPGCKP